MQDMQTSIVVDDLKGHCVIVIINLSLNTNILFTIKMVILKNCVLHKLH